MWHAAEQIKKRRKAKGLSQDAIAAHLGVSKSYVSQVEHGRKAFTPDQAMALAVLLEIPSDLVMVSGNKRPPDVDDVDAATATTAIRTATEQTPVVYPTSPAVVPKRSGRRRLVGDGSEIPSLIHVTKSTSSYRAHSYHTKVPPAAISPFIEAFTKEGDVVLDSFCGSGMTGVASRALNRHSLLSDLSPAAVHIARNYNTYCDPDQLEAAVNRVADSVRATMAWLYKPLGQDDELIEYTTWSDVFRCVHCAKEIVYWDVRGVGADSIVCSHCGSRAAKSQMQWVGEMPVETHVSKPGSRMGVHRPTRAELDLIEEIKAASILHWTPHMPFGADREMWRASHTAMGIKMASDFYTRRNLHGLAALRHSIAQETDTRLREALMFAFTACVNRASRRYQWNEKRPTNVMTGTLYISSLRYEWNVWSLFKRKAADVIRYYRTLSQVDVTSEVYQRSATDLSCLDDKSVDMAFIDPPFGSNIYYADSSLLWDAWLGLSSDQALEIVVNQRRKASVGGKGILGYGSLLTEAFAEVNRVLRPGARAIVAFSNSNDRVWEALQDAISDASMTVSRVHILDKGQPSIKGVKGQLGKEFVTRLDLALNLEKKSSTAKKERATATPAFIESSVRNAVDAGEQRSDHIYASVLRDALQANVSVCGITMPEINRVKDAVETRSALVSNELAQDVVAEYLADPSAIPQSENAPATPVPFDGRMVEGSRGSPFYLAHSYHTKVPPESIRPFIEHFTKPGDVVLDPFCGSGMTGVAASLAGRRAILNDLSPAAMHLAWNHTRACEPAALGEAFAKLESNLAEEMDRLYSTRDEGGAPATIRWTVWSTRHECPVCSKTFNLWDVVDQESGKIGRSTRCPACHHEADRRRFQVVSNVPAWLAFTRADGSTGERPTTQVDIDQATQVEVPGDLWVPSQPLGADREMYLRCALHLQGVRDVSDLYTRRNLKALGLIWREIGAVQDLRLRKALSFAFTNTAWHGTRMRRFNARGGHRPMTGTLYVPQLSSEANVLQVMKNKIAQLRTYYRAFAPILDVEPSMSLGSATDLQLVGNASVDYVFTDPPFGSNIFYADCNLIWEAWLGRVTDASLEAVVNKSLGIGSGGKSLQDYSDLMRQAMDEIVRVLKPGGWATVVFHNTDKDVWAAISQAASAAGFEFHEASSLDRKQQSHKGYKGRSGSEDVAHYDVVMNLRKPMVAAKIRTRKVKGILPLDLVAMVNAAKEIPGVTARGVQGVHAEIMRHLASRGSEQFPDFKDVRAIYEGSMDK